MLHVGFNERVRVHFAVKRFLNPSALVKAEPPRAEVVKLETRPTYTAPEINRIAEANEEVRYLFRMAERILSKTLTYDDMNMLLGFYDGIPLSERTTAYGVVAPDRIVVYRGPHLRMCEDLDELVDEIRVTVWHEIAHYFGIDDDDLPF